MVLQRLSLAMLQFLGTVLCYSSKALSASSHSFLRHSRGCLPGRVGNRRKSTRSWSPQTLPQSRGCCLGKAAAPTHPV